MRIGRILGTVLHGLGVAPEREKKKGADFDRKPGWFTAACVRLATRPDTPAALLVRLSRKNTVKVLVRIAERNDTDSSVLRRLAMHNDPAVRAAVAGNDKAPPDVMEMLAFDDNVDVRYDLAENYSAPVHVLLALVRDNNPYVSARARTTVSRLSGER